MKKGYLDSAKPLILLVPPARLERAAHGLGIRCSVHLSYGGLEMCLAVEKFPLPGQPERISFFNLTITYSGKDKLLSMGKMLDF
jgi:hypothetical protein